VAGRSHRQGALLLSAPDAIRAGEIEQRPYVRMITLSVVTDTFHMVATPHGQFDTKGGMGRLDPAMPSEGDGAMTGCGGSVPPCAASSQL
jgi:hypothetical protein